MHSYILDYVYVVCLNVHSSPCHTAACKEFVKDTNEINDRWEMRLLTETWQVLTNRPGVGKPEVFSFSGADGYDGYGYDKNGRNDKRVLDVDVHVDGCGVPDPLNIATAIRMFRRGSRDSFLDTKTENEDTM